MFPTPLKSFAHPHSVYRLEFPAHWDQVIEKDGASCGFGPHDRDDVGLWISVMAVRVDVDQIATELPNLMEKALEKCGGEKLRRDPTLLHYGLIADATMEGQGGHYWIIADSDVVLFASSQVPVGERDLWNPAILQVMASLQITREDQMMMRTLANDVLAQLRQRLPDQEFEFDGDKIRGKNQTVYLSNLYRDVRAAPARSESIIKRFVETLSRSPMKDLGNEVWDEIRDYILPMLKPKSYVHADGPTQHLLTSEWLSDVLICYVIRNKKIFRFITGWDLDQWGTNAQELHDLAIKNLSQLPWPSYVQGARAKSSGRVMVVDTNDSLASSRLLHPALHSLFAGALGNPFWAGVPCRNTLVLYSDRRVLKQRIGRTLKKDYKASAYPITARPFLVTRDGIAPAAEE